MDFRPVGKPFSFSLMARQVDGRLLSQSTEGDNMVDADECTLAAELDAVRDAIITEISTKKKNGEGGNFWSLLDAAPARRSSPEAELTSYG